MEIAYALKQEDYGIYLAFQKLQTTQLHRQKTILRWVICLMLLITLPVFQLDENRTAVLFVVGACLVWLLLSGPFMNRVLIRKQQKICRKKKLALPTMKLSLLDEGVKVIEKHKLHTYRYEDITHTLRFHGLLIITLATKEVLLVPRHAFASKAEGQEFFVILMQNCKEHLT